MGALIHAGLQALLRRLAPRPSSAAVQEALLGLAGVGAVEAVEISAAERGGTLVAVSLRAANGAHAREVACRAIEVLHERLPNAEIRVGVFAPEDTRAPSTRSGRSHWRRARWR